MTDEERRFRAALSDPLLVRGLDLLLDHEQGKPEFAKALGVKNTGVVVRELRGVATRLGIDPDLVVTNVRRSKNGVQGPRALVCHLRSRGKNGTTNSISAGEEAPKMSGV